LKKSLKIAYNETIDYRSKRG